MSIEKYIRLENANLHYASTSFRESSLKAWLFKGGWRGGTRVADIHAIKDITLTIRAGERVALLGHNGAGKSTLLKLIAGLYPLSSGERHVKGDIRSLFEIGLGFESEATGRENILYRGLLLGKSPREMRAIESEIIDFADLGEFIDYPIKTYSAGMLIRLAFGISTAVEGDILLLDEVIGAGDMAFFQKARRRFTQMIQKAEIMVLATHDMGSVKTLCNRALVLDRGRLVFDGSNMEGVHFYTDMMQGRQKTA